MENLVHTPDGELVSKLDLPGTKVRRKENLAYVVHTHFPRGEIRTVGEPCGKMNKHQDPKRKFVHVPVEANPIKGIQEAYCFHAYADTLEVVE